FHISRKTGYKWLARFRAHGGWGVADRARRPTCSPTRTWEDSEAEVLRLRDQPPAWGGRKLHARLVDLGCEDVPSPSTITAILRRRDRIGPGAGAARGCTRFQRERPNELWQMDFKGHFATATVRCHPLTVLDDHSRYCVGLRACGAERGETVRADLIALSRPFGIPERILCDNGPPWAAAGGEAKWTALA